MFVATVMTTAFSILPTLVSDKNNNNNTNIYYSNNNTTAGERAAEAIGRMGNKFFDKSLNVDPTIVVRPGTRFNVQCNADIPFYKSW